LQIEVRLASHSPLAAMLSIGIEDGAIEVL
jgi:hypothetical protein